MSEKKIKVGLIGYGLAGRVFHAPLLSAVSEFDLTTICSSRLAEIHETHAGIVIVQKPEAVLSNDDIDLIVIATPTATHVALAEKALLAGKHVVVDKPVALTLADAKRLVELSVRQNLKLFAFHNRRWDSDFLAVRDAISNDLVGDVTHFESHLNRFRPTVRDRWREDGSEGSGVWFDLGPHIVDQALLLFGRPDAVTADIAPLRVGAKSDDWAHIMLHYANRRAILHASLLSPDGESGGHPRFFVSGTKGCLTKRFADPQEGQLQAGVRPDDVSFGVDEDDLRLHQSSLPAMRVPVPSGCQQTFYELVAHSIRNGSEGPIGLDHLLDVCEIIEIAQHSAAERRTIELSANDSKRNILMFRKSSDG